MLIAEDLLLLLTPKSAGIYPTRGATSIMLAAAVLIELAAHGRVDIDEDDWLFVHDGEPVGHPLLDESLARLASADTAKDAVLLLVPGLRVRLLDDLAERGYLTKITRRLLWFHRTTRWLLEERGHRQRLCAQLRDILESGGELDERSAIVIALLTVVDGTSAIDPSDEDLAFERATEIANDHWPVDSVTNAILSQCLHQGAMRDLYRG